jgi:hypothetical protein
MRVQDTDQSIKAINAQTLFGDKNLTSKQHRAWKKHIQGFAKHHQLTDTEHASLIQFNCQAPRKMR